MKVKLLTYTQNPIDVMWTAARTCYSEKSPIEIWDLDRYEQTQEDIDKGLLLTCTWIDERQAKMWKLVKTVLDSGHESLAEFVNFVFAIEGVSRSCMTQLTRHRAGIVFCVQSQRYVEIKEDISNILRWEEAKPVLNKYFVDVNTNNWQEYLDCLKHYLHHIQMGMKPEDARMILPNATKTNITMSLNLRELIHICNLRLCSRAQAEIRDLFIKIKEEVMKVDSRLSGLLVPNCEKLGYCPEHKCCGRTKTFKQLFDDSISKEDLQMIKDRTENPQKNENLKKLMNMESAFEENQSSWHATENGRNLFTSLTEDED